ncbi:hypothetical protein ACFYYH_01140 [Streptomyces sp. NPDC002018]
MVVDLGFVLGVGLADDGGEIAEGADQAGDLVAGHRGRGALGGGA